MCYFVLMNEAYKASYNPSEEETAKRNKRARKIAEQNNAQKGIPGGPYKEGGARPAGKKLS